MTRHPTRNGVDTKVDLTAIVLEKLGELFNHVLRLGNRHAVAGDNGNVGRCFQDVVGIFDRDRLDLTLDHRLLVGDAGKA